MKSNSIRIFLFSILLSVVAGTSCIKNDVEIEEDPPICSFTGRFQIFASKYEWSPGDTVMLTTNLPACAKKQWVISKLNSSYSVSSYGESLQHVFTETGTYNIIIIVDDDRGNAKDMNPHSTITITEPYDHATVYKMNGVRNWNVYEDTMRGRTFILDTIRQYQETFAIEVLDESTIKFKNNILKAISDRGMHGVLDRYVFSDPSNTGLGWVHLSYYYKQDSIVCSSHPNKGGVPSSGKIRAIPYGITTTYHSIR